eukprot:12429286-Karenia_brevis.AAC.1
MQTHPTTLTRSYLFTRVTVNGSTKLFGLLPSLMHGFCFNCKAAAGLVKVEVSSSSDDSESG